MGLNYKRHSNAVIRSKRWKGLRLEALRRDGWACVQCGASGLLEVDHIKPVRDAPELSFDLGNLQALCRSCHTRKTRIECGHKPTSPDRLKWRELVADLAASPNEHKGKTSCLIQ
jgi:5-methylcytosine-specific restriction endonuclease McrA